MGQLIRELKAALTARGIDFSCCREKIELEQLLLASQERGDPEPATTFPPSAVGAASDAMNADDKDVEAEDDGSFFALLREDERRCWVEFVDDGDALCHFDDGTNTILPASGLDPQQDLGGPSCFEGSFEAARVEAFQNGTLLVAAVCHGDTTSIQSKVESLQALAFASSEVAELIGENAVFWRGAASSLRAPHLAQLAPSGAPSVAMVLPLAADAMRVISHSTGPTRDEIVGQFVSALEAIETHRATAEARLVSDEARLRYEQEEEFAAALAADQAAEEERKRVKETASEAAACVNQEQGYAQERRERERQEDAGDNKEERLAKARRMLADEFLQAFPAEGSEIARLVLRLPTGERVERTFSASEPFSQVQRWAECCHLLPEAKGRTLLIPAKFELSTAMPPRKFGSEHSAKSLSELDLAPSAALLLIDSGD